MDGTLGAPGTNRIGLSAGGWDTLLPLSGAEMTAVP